MSILVILVCTINDDAGYFSVQNSPICVILALTKCYQFQSFLGLPSHLQGTGGRAALRH
jgi:hypothetical protein